MTSHRSRSVSYLTVSAELDWTIDMRYKQLGRSFHRGERPHPVPGGGPRASGPRSEATPMIHFRDPAEPTLKAAA
ncbi:MAG: hypothetical protein Kow00122_02280 [Thermoleophilia bacterium]